MSEPAGIKSISQSPMATLASARPDSVQTIALNVPRSIRGHGGRPALPQVPLLPVFIAGEENRFAWFVCQSPVGRIAVGDPLRPRSVEQVVTDEHAVAPNPASGPDDREHSVSQRTLADRATVDHWGLIAMSPLLLVGPSGAGKTAIATHLATRLVEQIVLAVADELPGPAAASGERSAATIRATTSLFMPGVDFARYYARAVDSDEITRFRRDIDLAPVLVIDDVHLMVGKPAAQDELASRIESRTISGRPTVLTSRRLPTQVAGLRPLLVSRMLPGLTIPVRQPGPEARRELLIEFSRRRQLALGEDELALLCEGLEIDAPARKLDAALAHVDLYCRMKGCAPNVHAVRAAIGSIEPTVDLSTDRIAKLISRRYKLKLSDLKSGTRRQEVVRARSLAMYLVRQLTGASYHQIGKYFGGRDHTTVLHACRKTEAAIQEDTELRVTADELTEQLKTAS